MEETSAAARARAERGAVGAGLGLEHGVGQSSIGKHGRLGGQRQRWRVEGVAALDERGGVDEQGAGRRRTAPDGGVAAWMSEGRAGDARRWMAEWSVDEEGRAGDVRRWTAE